MLKVFLVYEYESCYDDNCSQGHSETKAIYATEQTAKQHVSLHGGHVMPQEVMTKVRDW